jgi:hypothetical protein
MGKAETELTSRLQALLALGLAHPALRSEAAFLRVLAALRMQAADMDSARLAFNQAALGYNAARRRMPAALVAASMNFHPIPTFDASTVDAPAFARTAFPSPA